MGGTIDNNGFPDFTADFDGRMIAAAGGQTGRVVLLNGQTLTMPWKAQQEIADSEPAAVFTVEDEAAGSHYQSARIAGSDLTGMLTVPMINLRTTYPDDTSSLSGGRLGPSVLISTGSLTGEEQATLQLFSGVDGGDPQIQLNGPVLTTGGSTTLSGQGGTTHEMESLIDLRISTQSAGLDITVDAFANLVLQGGTVTITSDTGAVDINAASGQQMTLDTSGGGDIFLTAAGAGGSIVLDSTGPTTINSGSGEVVSVNAANDRAVRANGWPIVPLRNVGTAVNGSAPATTAAAPAYKMQGGKATVTFTAGAGTLTFPTAFPSGLLTVLVSAAGNDVVVTTVIASSTGTSAALRLYIAGAAATGAADLTWLAIGW